MDLLIVPHTESQLQNAWPVLAPLSPVEYEHVVSQGGRGELHHQGHVEGLFVGEHPGLLRHGEGEVVILPEPEEDVLQSGAPGLVSLGESHLQSLVQSLCSYRVNKKCVDLIRG